MMHQAHILAIPLSIALRTVHKASPVMIMLPITKVPFPRILLVIWAGIDIIEIGVELAPNGIRTSYDPDSDVYWVRQGIINSCSEITIFQTTHVLVRPQKKHVGGVLVFPECTSGWIYGYNSVSHEITGHPIVPITNDTTILAVYTGLMWYCGSNQSRILVPSHPHWRE